MRIGIYSVRYDIIEEYKDLLKKYNLEDIIIDQYIGKYSGELITHREYYITINTLEELFNLMKELKQSLIINYEDNSITIYDDYVE